MSEASTHASSHTNGDATTLAGELRDLHRALDELIDALPETRAHMRTDRDGWTVKHELAYLAASHDLLLHLVQSLPGASTDAPAVLAAGEAELRRAGGEAMHVAKELRLTPLREHLAALAVTAAGAIDEHAALLDRPVTLNGVTAPAAGHIRSHLARTQEGITRIRDAMG